MLMVIVYFKQPIKKKLFLLSYILSVKYLKKQKMIKYWKSAVFKNYLNFGGTATRSEYWYYTLANFVIMMIIAFLLIIPNLIMALTPFEFWMTEGFGMYARYNTWGAGGLYILFVLGTLLPSIAIFCRRVRDAGKSVGRTILLMLIPVFGGMYGFYVLVLKGETTAPDTNEVTQKQPLTTTTATVGNTKPGGIYYEVRLSNVSSVPVGVTFKVAMTVTAKKFVVDAKTGKEKEEVINDEIQIGMMKAGKEIYLKSYRFTKTVTSLSLTLDQKPDKIGVDPYNKLAERA